MLQNQTAVSVGAEYIKETMLTPTAATLQGITANWIPKTVLTGLITVWDLLIQDHSFPMSLLLLLMIVDTATGAAAALKAGQFSSRKFRNSAFKLLGFTLVIATLHIICFIVPGLSFGGIAIDTMAVMYFASAEALSIFENVNTLTGVKIPGPFRLLLEKVFKKSS